MVGPGLRQVRGEELGRGYRNGWSLDDGVLGEQPRRDILPAEARTARKEPEVALKDGFSDCFVDDVSRGLRNHHGLSISLSLDLDEAPTGKVVDNTDNTVQPNLHSFPEVGELTRLE